MFPKQLKITETTAESVRNVVTGRHRSDSAKNSIPFVAIDQRLARRTKEIKIRHSAHL